MESKMAKTVGDILRDDAEKAGLPLRTLEQVKTGLARAKKTGGDKCENRMARMMLRYGRLTDEAILYVGDNYPSVWEE
jgi:hypothetical protein